MATQIQWRRGNTAQTATFTGAVAEITVDTDKKTIVVHDGTTAGGIPLARESYLTSNAAIAQGAYDKANSANVLAQASFNFANTANIKVDSAYTFANTANIKVDSAYAFANIANIKVDSVYTFANTANIKVDSAYAFANIANIKVDAAFTKANAANVLAQAAFDKANTDATSISATAGVYGNASIVPVFTLAANGRISSVTNTAIAIDTAALTSGTIADARLPTKGTAGTYANSTYIPVITTDAYGRVTGVTNTVIQSSTTSVQGIVQLTDSISSTSTTTAATPNSVKTAYDLAATKFNSSGGTISGDTTVTGNLIVNGITTTVNTTTVSTSDSLLKLANNNTAGDSLDIGFYGTYNATGQKYAGLVRQAGSNFFLFKDLTTDPTSNTLATGSTTAANTATLRANITGGTVSSLASAIGISDGGTNQTSFTNGIIAYNGTALATLANTGTAGTYGNSAYLPVITTDAYGRVSAVANTIISIDTSQLGSGTVADARLPTKGTAGTYANATYIPVITTDAYGRITGVTNTAIAIDTSAITSGTLGVSRGGTGGSTVAAAQAALQVDPTGTAVALAIALG